MKDKELFSIAEHVKQQATTEELEEFKHLNEHERSNWVIRQILKMEVWYGNIFNKFLYVNKNHIIYASELVGTEIHIYKVYLTNGIKLFIDDCDFNKILKEMWWAKK